jgi:hypothetical protein
MTFDSFEHYFLRENIGWIFWWSLFKGSSGETRHLSVG